jgi:hypothetical protein
MRAGVLLAVFFLAGAPRLSAGEAPRSGAPGGRAAAGVDSPGEHAPHIVSVSPAIAGERLVCNLETRGLPTDDAARSMRGGLPSGVEIAVELRGSGEETIVRRRVFFRLSFDLWDEIFRVEEDGSEARFETLASLRSFLETFEGLPVAPLRALAGDEGYRLHVDLVSHAIMPAERARIGEWIAGEGSAGARSGSGTARDSDEREVSFGIGSLIRFFYGGSSEAKPTAVCASSEWFRPEELSRATHPR